MHWMVIRTNTTDVVQNITNCYIASRERLVKIEQLDARQKSPCFKALRNYMEAVSTLERLCELIFAQDIRHLI